MPFKKQIAKVCKHCNKKHFKSTNNFKDCVLARTKLQKIKKEKQAQKIKQSNFTVVKIENSKSQVNIGKNQALQEGQQDDQSENQGQNSSIKEQFSKLKQQEQQDKIDNFETPPKKNQTDFYSTTASNSKKQYEDPIIYFPEKEASLQWFQYFQYYEGKLPYQVLQVNSQRTIAVRRSFFNKINKVTEIYFQRQPKTTLETKKIQNLEPHAENDQSKGMLRNGRYYRGKQSRISGRKITRIKKIFEQGNQQDLITFQSILAKALIRLEKRELVKSYGYTKHDIQMFKMHKQWTNALKTYRRPAYMYRMDSQYLLSSNEKALLCTVKQDKHEIIVNRRTRMLWKSSPNQYIRRLQFLLHYNPWARLLMNQQALQNLREELQTKKLSHTPKKYIWIDLQPQPIPDTEKPTQLETIENWMNSLTFQVTNLAILSSEERQKLKSELFQKRLKIKREQMKQRQLQVDQQMKKKRTVQRKLQKAFSLFTSNARRIRPRGLTGKFQRQQDYQRQQKQYQMYLAKTDQQKELEQQQFLKKKLKLQKKKYIRKTRINLMRQKMGPAQYRQMCRTLIRLQKKKIRQAQMNQVKQMWPLKKFHEQQELTKYKETLNRLCIYDERTLLLSKPAPLQSQIRQLKKSHGYWKFNKEAVQRKMTVGQLQNKSKSDKQTLVDQWITRNMPTSQLSHIQLLLYWKLINQISKNDGLMQKIRLRQLKRKNLMLQIQIEQMEKDQRGLYNTKWFDRDLGIIFDKRFESHVQEPQIKEIFLTVNQISRYTQQTTLSDECKLDLLRKILQNIQLPSKIEPQTEPEPGPEPEPEPEHEYEIEPTKVLFKLPMDVWPTNYIQQFKLWGTKSKRGSTYFANPQPAAFGQKQYFDSQMKTFVIAKKIDPSKFLFRRNIFHPSFKHSKQFDDRDIRIATHTDEILLKDYEIGKYVLPVRYRYVNELIQFGLDSTRNINKGQFMGWFTGYVIPQTIATQLNDNHNMCFYAPTQSGDYVISTCYGFYSMGPMYNSAQKNPNIQLAGLMTRQNGLQYVFRATRNILKGQHLVWNYNSAGKSYKLENRVDIRKLLKSQNPLEAQIGTRMETEFVDQNEIKSKAVYYLQQEMLDIRPPVFGRLRPTVASHSCKKKV